MPIFSIGWLVLIFLIVKGEWKISPPGENLQQASPSSCERPLDFQFRPYVGSRVNVGFAL